MSNLILQNIPERIKRDYKLYCIQHDVSMRDDLINYMKLRGGTDGKSARLGKDK